MTNDEFNSNVIAARSKRQAMDWSLVLTSQEIASTLIRSPDTGRWTLVVEPEDYTRALAAIHLYELENRGWAWRRSLPGSAVHFHWGTVVGCAFLAFVYALNSFHRNGLDVVGVMDTQAVRTGQWWRLFTAVTLHADIGHLAANLSIGFVVFGLVMARFGAGFGLLAAYLAGVGGNMLGLLLRPDPYLGLGASGMVMGGLGLMTVESIWLWRESPRAAKYILSGVFAGLMLLVLFGLDPSADVLAHAGGFFTGCILGTALAFLPDRILQSALANLVAGLILAGVILGTWGLAAR